MVDNIGCLVILSYIFSFFLLPIWDKLRPLPWEWGMAREQCPLAIPSLKRVIQMKTWWVSFFVSSLVISIHLTLLGHARCFFGGGTPWGVHPVGVWMGCIRTSTSWEWNKFQAALIKQVLGAFGSFHNLRGAPASLNKGITHPGYFSISKRTNDEDDLSPLSQS